MTGHARARAIYEQGVQDGRAAKDFILRPVPYRPHCPHPIQENTRIDNGVCTWCGHPTRSRVQMVADFLREQYGTPDDLSSNLPVARLLLERLDAYPPATPDRAANPTHVCDRCGMEGDAPATDTSEHIFCGGRFVPKPRVRFHLKWKPADNGEGGSYWTTRLWWTLTIGRWKSWRERRSLEAEYGELRRRWRRG